MSKQLTTASTSAMVEFVISRTAEGHTVEIKEDPRGVGVVVYSARVVPTGFEWWKQQIRRVLDLPEPWTPRGFF